MRVPPTVHELALPPKGVVREARCNNVTLAVWSLLEGERASLTSTGTAMTSTSVWMCRLVQSISNTGRRTPAKSRRAMAA